MSPLVAGESPQDMGLPSYQPGVGSALDFNPGLGLAPGRAGKWPRGRRGRNSPGPCARGVTQGVGLGGRCRQGVNRGAWGFICSSVGWQGFVFPCLTFPLYKTGVFPTLDMRKHHPHPLLVPLSLRPQPRRVSQEYGQVWW